MSPARGLYLARAVKIFIPLTAGCESTLDEKAPASGYNNLTDLFQGEPGQTGPIGPAGVKGLRGPAVSFHLVYLPFLEVLNVTFDTELIL